MYKNINIKHSDKYENYFANTKRYPIYAFFLTVILYTFALSCAGVLGNGLTLLEYGDWMTQHIPFIIQMGEVIKGNHSIWYSWNMGIGCGSIGTYAYYTFSPFNVFYWLLGQDKIHLSSALVIVLKAGVSALTFQIFITKLLRRSYYETIFFSTFYALNGFSVGDFHSISSLDAVLIFPVIASGIIALIRENKIKLLVFAYSYLFFTSLYMGYVAGICSFVIFFLYYKYSSEKMTKTEKHQAIRNYSLSVLIAFGITAILWVPSICNMLELRNSDEIYKNVINCNPIMLLNNMFFGMYQTLDGFIPYYYCGLITVMSVPLFVTNKYIRRRKRLYFSICLMCFILCMLVPPLNYSLHGFDNPNGVGFRYAFVLSFVLITILAEQYIFIVGKKGISTKFVIGWYLLAIFILITGKYTILKRMGTPFDSNKWYVFTFNIIFIFVIFCMIRIQQNKNIDKVTRKLVFTIVMVLEIVLNIIVIQRRMDTRGSVIVDEQYYMAARKTVDKIYEESKGDKNVRTIYQDPQVFNIALENNLPSIVYFSSLMNDRLTNMLHLLGFEYAPNSMSGNGWTPVTASLLGIDYIIDGAYLMTDDPNVPVMLGANEHYYQNYVRNKKPLPLAFYVDKRILDYKPCSSVFENQIKLLGLMAGRKVDIYKEVDMILDTELSDGIKIDEKNDEVIITNCNFPDKGASVRYSTKSFLNRDVFVNLCNDKKVYKDNEYWYGPTITADYDVDLYHTVRPRIYPNQIFKSGNKDKNCSSFIMNIPPEIKTVEYKKGYFFEYNDDEYDEIYKKLNKQRLNITEFRDGYVKGDVVCNEECVLFSSIPYEKGWKAYIDGEKVDIIPIVEDAFVGILLPSGNHDVVFEYVAPGMYVGRCVTIATAILLFFSTPIMRRRYSGKSIH